MKRLVRDTSIVLALTSFVALGCGGDADMAEDGMETMPPAEASAPPAATTPASGETGAMLDPNAASRDDLMAAGLTAEQADALIAGRPSDNMVGVDQALAAHADSAGRSQIYTRVWRPIDLNTASEAEMHLIPGMTDRMVHEFDEYRPYDGIERFRTEIGKYVDETEVARLERYVTIR
jgi:hypothetical protein